MSERPQTRDEKIFEMAKGFFEHVMHSRIPFSGGGEDVPKFVAECSITAARAFYAAWDEEAEEKVVITEAPIKLAIDDSFWIKLTPRAKRVLALAAREQRNRNENHLGPDHILFAIISEGDGRACEALKATTDFTTLRERLRAQMWPEEAKKP